MITTRILRTALALLVLLPFQAQAALSKADLQQLTLDVWRIRADFHMYTVMTGNRKYAEQLEESILKGQDTMDSLLDSAETDAELQLVEQLQQHWEQYREKARSNTVAELGYTDAYTIQDMLKAGVAINDAIREYQGAGEDKYSDLIALGSDLQQMASEYLYLAADPSGGMAAGTDTARLSFKEAVPAFDEKLKGLRKKYQNDKPVMRTLRQVGLRWQFIRDSLVNFSENSVPFLVHRYSHEMTEELALVTTLGGSGDIKPQIPGAGGGNAPPPLPPNMPAG